MVAPTRMPRYTISNEGMGPYATFYCDRDNREYRSTPNIQATVTDNVKRGALGGFLRNVPIVGDSVANQMDNNRYRTQMSQEELATAWGQTQQYFRECPTCHQILCIPDFDEVSGFCDEDSPRAADVAAAKGQQAAAALKGMADVFGIGGAVKQSMERAQVAAQSAARCPKDGTMAAPGTQFCPNCGTAMVQAAPPQAAAAAASAPCSNCGAALAPGAKFCPNCGTPAAQEKACSNCGTTLAAGAKFCPNCGTASA
jgi:RNA polymerase subunit RPABC4/transcription elongation factor Spt4